MLPLIGKVAKLVQVTVVDRHESRPQAHQRGQDRSNVPLKSSSTTPSTLRVGKSQPGILKKKKQAEQKKKIKTYFQPSIFLYKSENVLSGKRIVMIKRGSAKGFIDNPTKSS